MNHQAERPEVLTCAVNKQRHLVSKDGDGILFVLAEQVLGAQACTCHHLLSLFILVIFCHYLLSFLMSSLLAGVSQRDSKKVTKRGSLGSLARSKSKGRAQQTAGQTGQDESLIQTGRSRSEDGSPRATLEDQDADQDAVDGMRLCVSTKPCSQVATIMVLRTEAAITMRLCIQAAM